MTSGNRDASLDQIGIRARLIGAYLMQQMKERLTHREVQQALENAYIAGYAAGMNEDANRLVGREIRADDELNERT